MKLMKIQNNVNKNLRIVIEAVRNLEAKAY